MTISEAEVKIDGLGKGTIRLEMNVDSEGKRSFLVTFERESAAKRAAKAGVPAPRTLLREFPNISRSLRSYRRFILLSEEIEAGF